MRLGELRKLGHWPSLLAAFIHFEVSFAVWVLLGVLAPFIAKDLDLSPSAVGVMVAVPLLAGAFFRIILGWLADTFGPRAVGTASMALVLIPLCIGWVGGGSFLQVLGIGSMLGLAGASFAVALPLAASHYPASHRGLALGIAGAGNSGTIVAGLVAPRLALHIGWHNTFALAMVPVLAAAIAFAFLAKEAPGVRGRRRFREVFRPLRHADCWWVCGLYAVTFGGFVGLASYLPTLMVSRYGVTPVLAGTLAAAAAGAGSFLRPVGGSVADRVGGTRVLTGVYLAVAVLSGGLAASSNLVAGAVMMVCLLGVLGIGNGAVFQLVSMRFSSGIGVVTGLVGAAGGLAGFLMPSLFGLVGQQTGSYSLAFVLFGATALLAAPSVVSIRLNWTRRSADLGLAEGVI